MTLKEKIYHQLISAQKAKDSAKVSTLRMLTAAIMNEEIKQQKREDGLNDDETIAIVSKQIKQRKDSIEQYKSGNREDLVATEEAELKILQEFMPEQMNDDDVRAVVKNAVASGLTDMGPLMGKVMGELKGQADGNIVRRIVEEEIN